MKKENFWETKKLNELTQDEWESLCDGCAKCCIHKQENRQAVRPESLSSLCYLLDMDSCRCSSYATRKELFPSCISLSPDQPELFEQMPETCSYRLLHEGKPLPDWHPLVTGDPASSLQHKIVVCGKLNIESATPVPAQEATPLLETAPPPPIQAITENAGKMEQKTNQVAEDARKMLYSTLDAVEATSLTGKFLATTSHEIRTALNGIVGTAQLISDTQLTHEQRNCVDTILESTTGLLKTISYMLEISKIESGQMEICETSIDLRSMCDKLYGLFHPLAEQKGIDFKCECQRNVPLSVMCDEGLVGRVLENLVRYALENTQQGTVILNVECQEKGPDGAKILFEVIDTGAGIDEGRQAAILGDSGQVGAGSFQQLHERAGMDLAVCKKLVELMGGELGLVSAKGKGSTFSTTLTLRQANNPASFSLHRIKTVTKPNTRVLLAEDNKVNQKVVTSILRKAGCEVDAVDNGEDAVRLVRENHYDMVFMDCQMPKMNGFEATVRIRAMGESSSKVPIIALTAHAMKGDKQKCLDSGMDDYLPKPVGKQELIDTINKYTASKKSLLGSQGSPSLNPG